MEVTRFQEFGEDGLVQLFGYVGDYEVSCYVPIGDERVQALRRQGGANDKAVAKRRS